MATKYTNQRDDDGGCKIFRNDKAVATLNPPSGEVTYIGDGKKFAVPISKEIALVLDALGEGVTSDPIAEKAAGKEQEAVAAMEEASTPINPEALADPMPPTPPRDPKDVVIDRQEKHIASLQEEIRELQRRASGDLTPKVPDRYKGIDMHPEGSPVWSREQGNCTPEFVKWAREGGYTKEEFLQVYKGRIKDLSYTGCKENRPNKG